jgi:hypothetical protein
MMVDSNLPVQLRVIISLWSIGTPRSFFQLVRGGPILGRYVSPHLNGLLLRATCLCLRSLADPPGGRFRLISRWATIGLGRFINGSPWHVEDIRMEPVQPILIDNISDTWRWQSSKVPDCGAHHGDLPIGVNVVPSLYSRVSLSSLEIMEALQTEMDGFVMGLQSRVIVVRFFSCWPITRDAKAL